MTANIPTKVKVGPIVYDVIIVDEMAGDVTGEIDYKKCTIRILKSDEQHMYHTLCHEILHAIYLNLGWDQEEGSICKLASYIADVFDLKQGDKRK